MPVSGEKNRPLRIFTKIYRKETEMAHSQHVCNILWEGAYVFGPGNLQALRISLLGDLLPRARYQHGRKQSVHIASIQIFTVLFNAFYVGKDQRFPQTRIITPQVIIDLPASYAVIQT